MSNPLNRITEIMRKTSPKFSKPKVLAAKRGSKAAPLSLTAAVRGTDGKLHFPGAPLFTPSLSPQEVLEAGAFGGVTSATSIPV